MKKIFIYVLAIAMFTIGCNQNAESNVETSSQENTQVRKIVVAEHLDGGSYTFIRGNEAGKEIWIAVRQMPVEVGEVLYFDNAMEMKDFKSKSLDRTFASILFVNDVSRNSNFSNSTKTSPHGGMPGMMSSSDGHTKPEVKIDSEIKIEPLTDGMTVEKVNNEKASLAGKKVKVRGVVTKYNGGIMNRNWIHIQDGTGSGKSADITITSSQGAKVGDTIIIEGTVAVDKDFGAGYFYEVIVEDADITIEKKI